MTSSENVKAGVYGIELNEYNKYLEKIGFDYKNKIMAIVSNSQDKDLSVKFVKWILDMK